MSLFKIILHALQQIQIHEHVQFILHKQATITEDQSLAYFSALQNRVNSIHKI